MRRFWPVLVAVGLLGCQAPEGKLAPELVPEAPEAASAQVAIGLPPRLEESELRLFHSGASFRLGEPYDQAMAVFPMPKSAFEFNELPLPLQKNYVGRGWETSRLGFGVVLHNDRVLLAVSQTDRADAATAEQFLKAYDDAFTTLQPITVEDGRVKARFFEQAGQRLMLLVVNDGDIHLTAALGQIELMDAIGANPAKVREGVTSMVEAFRPRTGREP